MKNTQTQYHIDVTPEEDNLFREHTDQPNKIKTALSKLMQPKLNTALIVVAGLHVAVVLAIFGFTNSSNASEHQISQKDGNKTETIPEALKKNDEEFLTKEVAATPQPTPPPVEQQHNPPPTQPMKAKPAKQYTAKYVVKTGDTVYSISRKYKLNVDRLIKINDIKDPNKIVIGQTLKFM
jgi:LysM repeat protein